MIPTSVGKMKVEANAAAIGMSAASHESIRVRECDQHLKLLAPLEAAGTWSPFGSNCVDSPAAHFPNYKVLTAQGVSHFASAGESAKAVSGVALSRLSLSRENASAAE